MLAVQQCRGLGGVFAVLTKNANATRNRKPRKPFLLVYLHKRFRVAEIWIDLYTLRGRCCKNRNIVEENRARAIFL